MQQRKSLYTRGGKGYACGMKKLFMALLLAATQMVQAWQQVNENAPEPAREFRAAWVATVFNLDWPSRAGLAASAQQAELMRIIQTAQKLHLNAIILQVRPTGDALYNSSLEPWSGWLSGPGVNPGYDPLALACQEAHKRGIEVHAWFNPFRATVSGKSVGRGHVSQRYSNLMLRAGSTTMLNPSASAAQSHVQNVILDVVRRYNIDGVHLDDYFYPYPVAGQPIPDDASFQKYNNGIRDRGDWRRYNVNLLIEMLHRTIHETKPWVKFGISPFGIYHNQKNGGTIPGSDTGGLQNYDDLYADVIYWINKGWVDYTVPQVYWQIGHPTADYDRLCRWWAKYAAARPLAISQDIDRTAQYGDLRQKLDLQRSLKGVSGSCMWYSAALAANTGGYATALRQDYHQTPALQPLMPFIDKEVPGKPKKVKAIWMPDGYYLFWTAPKGKDEMQRARQYAVYAFAKGEKVNLDDAAHIVAITSNPMLKLPFEHGQQKFTYVVTALDRLQNESKPAKKKLKL